VIRIPVDSNQSEIRSEGGLHMVLWKGCLEAIRVQTFPMASSASSCICSLAPPIILSTTAENWLGSSGHRMGSPITPNVYQPW